MALEMTFDDLLEFCTKRMRMSHIYQPVMLIELLRSQGSAQMTDIAKSILEHDQSQIEYYEKITRDMVGTVLRKRGVVAKEGATFILNGYQNLTQLQVGQLIEVLQSRLAKHLQDRGRQVWEHRRSSAGYISGTLRYEVLKAAQFRCELCGISADNKALEVDHILPRNHGGTDAPSNLQALCYSCNAMKRDRDDTDFRKVKESYTHREKGCLFCEITTDRVIAENELAYAISDGFPVTPLHALIIPKRHVEDYFGLSRPELNACDRLLRVLKQQIQEQDPSVVAFNIGMNAGQAAGQTIFHSHTHLIPRRPNDVENPRGGVRHLIPGKGFY